MKLKRDKKGKSSTKKSSTKNSKKNSPKTSTKTESSKSSESTDSTQTDDSSDDFVLTDFLNADTVKIDDEEQLNKTLSHVYAHDVYDTLGVLEDLTKILVEEEDLKAVYEAKELFTSIKHIKENLAVEY